MPRVVPSQVVQFIVSIPGFNPMEQMRMNGLGQPALSSTLRLVEQIPQDLLTMDGPTYAMFIYAQEQLREVLQTWRANQTAGHSLREFQFGSDRNPLVRLRDALARCPDQSPTPSTSELSFISDADLRDNLRIDLGAIDRALSNSEWKGATVISGATIEALLLWVLQERPPADITRVAALPPKLPNKPLEEWHLPEYIDAAERLGVLKAETITQVRLAKNFRNLIHPGRAQRLGQTCDRATALSAVAGMEHVVRDLTP
jgi:hypothetical protein